MRPPGHPRRSGLASTLGLVLPLLAVPGLASAQLAGDVMVERFTWREHTTPIEVKETGPRFAVGAVAALPRTSGPLAALRARVYFGSVDYNGSFQFNAAQPAHGATNYLGATLAAEARYRWPAILDAVAGLELDTWRRHFSASQREDYQLVGVRLGLERRGSAASPLVAGAGMRVLTSAREISTTAIGNGLMNVTLHPGLGSSPYLHLGWRVSPRVTLLGTWEALRLGRSNPVTIGGSGSQTYIFQPTTDMSRIGLRVAYGSASVP